MHRLLLLLVCIAFGVAGLDGTAHAWGWKRTPRPVVQGPPPEPPAPDAKLRDCEPMRRKVLTLNSDPTWVRAVQWPIRAPQIAWLKKRHRHCVTRYSLQQKRYLNSVQIDGGQPITGTVRTAGPKVIPSPQGP